MSPTLRYAINRISAPRIPFADFLAMSRRLGVEAVEIRNDLAGVESADGTPARQVGAAAREQGVAIRSINALYPFDLFDGEREAAAQVLIDYAAGCGAQALVLCPLNSLQDVRSAEQRHADLVHALRRLKPMLEAAGLIGLVEPLGFEECSLRRKSQAVRAFEEVGVGETFRLVHDTFHHHLAGEDRFYPEWTGLVHISGVEDTGLAVAQMRDAHRVLVGPSDRLGNAEQLCTLLDAGYPGYASFEPFAAEIAQADDIEARLKASMEWLQGAVAAARPAPARSGVGAAAPGITLRLGVIGTGAIGQDHVRRITRKLTGARVGALNDIDLAQARAFATREQLDARVLGSAAAVIGAPDVDAVLVTSWGPSHEALVLAAIAAGKPVFCEKPLATTAAGALRIVEAEMKHGRPLVQVGFMRRYDAGYRALKKVVDDGTIGAPLMVHCTHRNPAVPEGYVGDMGITDTFIHEIDTLRWLLGDDYVSAQVIEPRRTRHAHAGLHDPIIVLLETRQGIRIDCEVFVACRFGYDIQCQVVGEDGAANLPDPASVPLRLAGRASTAIQMDWKQRFIDAYDVELQEWIDSTRAGRVLGPTAWDGYFAAVTADACIAARHARQVLPITIADRPAFYAPVR
jgi:myo-inositol 2-dehydrogenase/D-chiro-inositol 1-dehydrogenase